MNEQRCTSVTGPYVTTASGKLAIAYHARVVKVSGDDYTFYRTEATCLCGTHEWNNYDSYAGALENMDGMIQAARTCTRLATT